MQKVSLSNSTKREIPLIRCDNGTNFVGAQSELQRSFSEMTIKYYVSRRIVELIGSHGRTIHFQKTTWERQIKSTRVILSALLKQRGTSLNNESLITLLTEVESIVSSRPLTMETLSDIEIEAPLSPINLLIIKFNVVLPTPGEFKQPHFHSRQRWRGILYIVQLGDTRSFGIDGERSF